MPKFRKLPVVIDAFKIQPHITDDWPEWLVKAIKEKIVTLGYDFLEIKTLEGTMKANIGDYIIQGINGEFYPCKPNIFEKTYESVE
jgi:hypothetical protein